MLLYPPYLLRERIAEDTIVDSGERIWEERENIGGGVSEYLVIETHQKQ